MDPSLHWVDIDDPAAIKFAGIVAALMLIYIFLRRWLKPPKSGKPT